MNDNNNINGNDNGNTDNDNDNNNINDTNNINDNDNDNSNGNDISFCFCCNMLLLLQYHRRLVDRLENIKNNAQGNGMTTCLLCDEKFGKITATPIKCSICEKVVISGPSFFINLHVNTEFINCCDKAIDKAHYKTNCMSTLMKLIPT